MRIAIYTTGGRIPAKKESIRRMVRRALKAEGRQLKAMNIIIVDDAYMKKLNETYLGRKRSTNVISFDLDDVSEIYVSRDRAGDSYDLFYYILHGLLHLLGYDHRNKGERIRMHKKCVEYIRDE
jgi:probable rRNA maturation factor